jgi:SAM-dependent MidA family methyltransferase
MKNTLPAPSPLAKAHTELLRSRIVQKIQQEGPIPFSEFMGMALYEPGLGYYSAGARKFGPDGDFVTAPEISPLFSRCLAKQCAQVLAEIPGGSILEFGAGSGVMARDILLWLRAQNSLPEHYFILEVSADLRDRQKTLLAELEPSLFNRVVWLDNLSEAFSGVILANEVLDAMPVTKFFVDQDIREFYVDYCDNEFAWCLREIKNPGLIEKIKALPIFATAESVVSEVTQPFSEGAYESEINTLLAPWIKSLSDILIKGACFIVDYGFPAHEYYHPDRNRGTIMCHYQHRAHDNPLIHVGIQDITAHVDFTAIAEAASETGFCVEGFATQAAFLMNCGLMEFYPAEDALEQYRVSQEIKKLTLPSEMGELFKVMALTKNFSSDLLGFSSMNRLERL